MLYFYDITPYFKYHSSDFLSSIYLCILYYIYTYIFFFFNCSNVDNNHMFRNEILYLKKLFLGDVRQDANNICRSYI